MILPIGITFEIHMHITDYVHWTFWSDRHIHFIETFTNTIPHGCHFCIDISDCFGHFQTYRCGCSKLFTIIVLFSRFIAELLKKKVSFYNAINWIIQGFKKKIKVGLHFSPRFLHPMLLHCLLCFIFLLVPSCEASGDSPLRSVLHRSPARTAGSNR